MVRFLHEVVACVGRIGVQAYLSRISYGLMEAGKCHHRGDQRPGDHQLNEGGTQLLEL